MKKFIAAIIPISLLALSGCEWDTSGTGYNSRYNWVDFNGVYRGLNGGLLITDYTATPGTSGVTNTVTGESAGTSNDSDTISRSSVSKKPIVRGTFTVSVGTSLFWSDDGNGNLTGSGPGSIDYGTGVWNVKSDGGPIGAGFPVTVGYQYTISGTGSGGAGSGVSGKSIYTLTVSHQGEKLSITDNNGAVYQGALGNTRVNEGTASGTSGPVAGDTVVMQFNASGTSAAGQSVRLAGTLQGVVRTAGSQLSLADRRMFGTWIESGGKTGDINGQASPIGITVVPETPVEPSEESPTE